MTTTGVDRFLEKAGPFLVSDPVANTMLLTEARFWMWLPDPVLGARFGWWTEGGAVHGAFVSMPDHAPICSPLSAGAVAELPEVLARATRLDVQARDVSAVTAAWQVAHQRALRPTARRLLLALHDSPAQSVQTGAPRMAEITDLPLLRSWFDLFRARHHDDPSQVEFVIDHPLQQGGIILWEARGRPVAMASRTPEVAGMVRLGLAFQPTDGSAYATAAFGVACTEASRTAGHVLVLSGTTSSTATYRSFGFEPVLERVVLEVGG